MCAFDEIAMDPTAFDTCLAVESESVCVDEWNLNGFLEFGPGFAAPSGDNPSGIGCAGEGSLNAPEKKVFSW